MRKYCKCSKIDRHVRDLVRKGWTYWHGSKHGRLRHPSGRPTVTVPCTPSDEKRGAHNFMRDVKRATTVSYNM